MVIHDVPLCDIKFDVWYAMGMDSITGYICSCESLCSHFTL